MWKKRFTGGLCAAAVTLCHLSALPAALTIRAETDVGILYTCTERSRESNELTWTLKADGTVVLSGEGAMRDTDETALSYFLGSHEDDAPYKVRRLIVEEGITHIAGNAFYSGETFSREYYDSLVSVSLPESLRSIGGGAFYDCDSLQEINIPAGVNDTESYAFGGTPWYTEYRKQFTDGYVLMNHVLLESPNTETVIIPDGVETVAAHSVGGDKVQRVVIPDGVTKLGENAFVSCGNLAEIEIPESVTEIGMETFVDTKWFQNRRAESPFVTVNGILISGIDCEGDITIPDNVKRIGLGAFIHNEAITSVVIPDSVTEIGPAAFFKCTALKEITFPESISCIPLASCIGCTSLTDIHYSESIREIGAAAFVYCNALTDVVIPESVAQVELGAFLCCANLNNVTFLNPYCRVYGGRGAFARDFLLDFDDEYQITDYLTGKVYAYSGSLGEEYAEQTGYPFESLGEIPAKDFPKPLMYGDVTLDRTLDVADAVFLARFLAEDAAVSITKEGRICADIGGNAGIDPEDVTVILRRIAKLEPQPFDVFVYDHEMEEAHRQEIRELMPFIKII